MANKRIYRFGSGIAEGNAGMNMLLGGKGANLAEMASLGIPVPPGFTITTDVCKTFEVVLKEPEDSKNGWLGDLFDEIYKADEAFGDTMSYLPLVSVRSGAPVSMPGMMDTILNVGLTSETLVFWEKQIGQRAAWDSYRRLIQMLGATAYGISADRFEFQLASIKKQAGVEHDWQLDVTALQTLVSRYKHVFAEITKEDFPDTREAQIKAAVLAVFNSWHNERAVVYRKMNKIDPAMGTAVTVQAMVFGNMGADSGTGVLFTRDPATGGCAAMGEFLENAQGEDVVAGIRTPRPWAEMESLGPTWSLAYDDLQAAIQRLEEHYRDMMDIEFTVQQGKLYLLQCRIGKRSALAAFKIARQFFEEGQITAQDVMARLSVEQFKLVRRPRIADGFKVEPHGQGKGASPGVVTGKPVFSAADAVNCTEPCILVTEETNPDDIAGMAAALGILTKTGGSTCHAAVVARAMDKPCVVGCTDLEFMPAGIGAKLPGVGIGPGAKITIDGATGRVWVNVDVPVVDGSQDPDVQMIAQLALGTSGSAMALGRAESPIPGIPCRYTAADWWGNVEALNEVLGRLAQAETRQGIVLDLTPPHGLMSSADLELNRAMGQVFPPGDAAWKLVALDIVNLFQADLSGLTLLGATLPPNVGESMKNAGFKFASSPKTVADLMYADSLVLTQDFVQNIVGGQKALDELIEMLQAYNEKPLGILTAAVPIEYAVFTQLAGAA
jgi:pyruvate,orthophosphate dikinase